MAMGASNPLMSCAEVAERLGVPERFVRRLIAERRIAFVHIGKYVRIEHEALERFINDGRVEPD